MGTGTSKKKKTTAERNADAQAAVDKADAAHAKKLAALKRPGTQFASDDHYRMQQRRALDRRSEAQMAQTVKRYKAKTANDAAYAPHAATWNGGRRRKRKTRHRRRKRKTRHRRRKRKTRHRRRKRKTRHRRRKRKTRHRRRKRKTRHRRRKRKTRRR